MVAIGIVACEKIMDRICLGCLKCLKAIWEGAGKFAEYDPTDLRLVYLTSCGGCPGFIFNKVGAIRALGKSLDVDAEIVHIGTCIQSAVAVGRCPIDLERTKQKIEEKLGKKVIIGTHPYPP